MLRCVHRTKGNLHVVETARTGQTSEFVALANTNLIEVIVLTCSFVLMMFRTSLS